MKYIASTVLLAYIFRENLNMDREIQKLSVEGKRVERGTEEGNHGKTSVDDFLFMPPFKFLGAHVFGQTNEVPSDVSGGALAVVLVEVSKLNAGNGQEDLEVSSKANLGNSGKRIGLGKLISWYVPSRVKRTVFLSQHTEDGQHADTSVFDFGPLSVLQVSLDLRKTHGIKTEVSGHGSIEFLGLDEEWNRL